MRSLSLLLILLCVLVVPAALSADTITHQASYPLTVTNWKDATMSIPKFNGVPECLQSICFELSGHVEGNAKFESLDGAPATVVMNLQATVTLSRPDLTTLVTVIPLVNSSDNVSAFDGTIDFGGTSGKSYIGVSGDKIESACTSTVADKALFCGSGNIDLPVSGAGTSNGSGPGSLILQFNTNASSQVTVTYTYICLVPAENTTWGQIRSLYE